jgi:glycosyltransferase involved in cell wall biosynthesis
MLDRTVLVIAYYFPPIGLSGVQRTLKFVKYLSNYGWKPIVLTTSPDAFYAFDETLDEEIGDETIVYRTESKKKDKLKITKFPNYFTQKIGRALIQTFYQPDRAIKWKKQAIALAEKILFEHKVDMIFSTAPPFTDFLIAKEISERFKIPYLVDYRDIWVDNPFHFYATPFHKSYAINLEKNVLKTANKAIVTTRHSKETLLKRYSFLNHDDIVIIPHGFDSNDFLEYQDVKPDRNKFTITHSGLFQDNRTPKYFLKALANFIKNNPQAKNQIEARFIGIMRKGHLKYIKKFNLNENVVITGYVAHKSAIDHLMQSDILWLMLDDNVRSPGKLFEYFGARKPLIACVPDGVIRKIALDSKSAIVTDPKNIIEIEQAIASMYKLWQSNTLPVPKFEFVEQYDRAKLTGELARELSLGMDL